jgi:transcriptional regulator with GAF, ATPase, and Fis domain
VLQQLHRAAATDATVLLEGESGTGKELFARALHAFSPRADGPFVAINCAAIPEGLLESELFGHEKGAFTGAVGRKPGRFEMAHRGTLFLDEIGDMPIGLQAKILRVLEDRQVERVGGTTAFHVDTRVVAATNRGLRAAVAARQFREDLYFRLSVFPITVPPLRERVGDVPILAHHFVERFCRDLNKKPLPFSVEALDEMRAYRWPGNVRELQNCVERAVILCDTDTIHARHLSLSLQVLPMADGLVESPRGASFGGVDPFDLLDLSGTMGEAVRRMTAEVERRKVGQALRDAGGDKARAAEVLQVSYKSLLQKQREHGIKD